MLINDLSYLEVEAAKVNGSGEALADIVADAIAEAQTRAETYIEAFTSTFAFEGEKVSLGTLTMSSESYT